MNVAFDLETAGLVPGEPDDSARGLAARRALGPDADRQAIQRYLALSVPLARMVCYSLAVDTFAVVGVDGSLLDCDGQEIDGAHVRVYDGERELVAACAEQLDVALRSRRLVTFNGRRFDLPIIIARLVAYGISVPEPLMACFTAKPWVFNAHVDLMLAFGGGMRIGGTLDEWSTAILGQSPKHACDGSAVDALVAARAGSALGRYCLGDTRATLALAARWPV